MATSGTPERPHSAEHFGEQRDFWWNDDFVTLMARRWRLDAVRLGLDVGAGVGHWGRVLLPHLAPGAHLVGIDREDAWILEAHRRAERAGLADRLTYRLGDAARIPFHDGVFDLVTCQTLLIHVPDPRAVLREMIRVLKPGGLVAVAEPNNLANVMVLGSTLFHADPARLLDVLRLHLVCQRGKEQLGEGHNSIGDLLPGWFAEVGLEDVSVHLSDKAMPLVPPYAGREQEVRRAEALASADRKVYAWDRAETRRFFLAGGGSEADFERLWGVAGVAVRETAAALRAGTEHTAGGAVQYLVSGRKAAAAAVSGRRVR
jgi:SAM-dependent methyltransferase